MTRSEWNVKAAKLWVMVICVGVVLYFAMCAMIEHSGAGHEPSQWLHPRTATGVTAFTLFIGLLICGEVLPERPKKPKVVKGDIL